MSDLLQTIICTSDAEVREASPSANFSFKAKASVNGGSGSDDRQYFLHFTLPFPKKATIISADLVLVASGTWPSSNDLTARRVTEKWSESKIKWNNRPAVSTSHADVTHNSGDDGDTITFDVSTLLQQASNGSDYFGFRIEIDQDHTRSFHAGESANTDVRPQLVVEWTEAPEAPVALVPDHAQAVADEFPVLAWGKFTDKSGNTKMANLQVQLTQDAGYAWTAADGFAAPDYDTGQIAGTASTWDSDDGSFTGIAADDVWYWTVSVWDESGYQSDFSEVAVFNRTTLGTLVIDNPNATVPETTPPISWTLTGRTQESWTVTLFELNDDGSQTKLWQDSASNAETETTPDHNLIKTGHNYRARVEVWDDVDRADDAHTLEDQDFVFVADGTPDPVLTLTAEINGISPDVLLTFTRTAEPDFWVVSTSIDNGATWDDQVDDLIAHDYFVSGTTYAINWWATLPRIPTLYRVSASVISGSPSTPKRSTDDPTAAATSQPVGIWLVDPRDNTNVMIAGQDSADFVIGEAGTTYDLVGARAPVRIIDIVRGYEGGVSGLLLSQADRATMLRLKGRSGNLQLVIGDLSIPIRIEEMHITPTPIPGDEEFIVSFTFFQTGAPWPTR